MDQRIFNKRVQQLFNDMQVQPPLLVDGAVGPKTEAALLRLEVKYASVRVAPLGPTQPFWIGYLEKRLGWTEFDHDAEIAKDWPLVGLNYKTVIGTSHAWCDWLVRLLCIVVALSILTGLRGLQVGVRTQVGASLADTSQGHSYLCVTLEAEDTLLYSCTGMMKKIK